MQALQPAVVQPGLAYPVCQFARGGCVDGQTGPVVAAELCEIPHLFGLYPFWVDPYSSRYYRSAMTGTIRKIGKIMKIGDARRQLKGSDGSVIVSLADLLLPKLWCTASL